MFDLEKSVQKQLELDTKQLEALFDSVGKDKWKLHATYTRVGRANENDLQERRKLFKVILKAYNKSLKKNI